MKNKFFVGIEIVFLLAFIFIASITTFIIACVYGVLEEDLWLIILLLIMTVVPTLFLLWGVYAMAAQITIDEKGITKSLFGIKLKYYDWEELSHIKLYGNFVASSISFFKKRKETAIFYRYIKYERIYFYLDKTRWEVIDFYAPEPIKEMIEKVKSNFKKEI